MGIGSRMGAGLSGYHKGRRDREDEQRYIEERDYRMERRGRQRKQEAWRDPMDKRKAVRGEGRDERVEAYEEYSDPYKRRSLERGEGSAIREEDYQEFADPSRRRALERSDRSGMRIDEFEEFNDPYRRRGVERGERGAVRGEERELYDEPYRRRGVERGDRGGERAEERELYDEPFRRRGVERQDAAGARQEEYGEGDINQYRKEESSAEFAEQSRNAIAIFDQTGNTQPLEDFYNDIYPDDGTVAIESNPDGTYTATYGDGTVSEPQSKEDLLRGSEKFFSEAPQMDNLNVGFGGRGYSSGTGGRRGGAGGRRGGPAVKQSAYMEKVTRLAQDLQQYDGMPRGEAIMEAHARAAQSSRTPPEEAIQKFYANMQKEMLAAMGDIGLRDPEEQEAMIARAEELAGRMTDTFAEKYFGEGGRPGPSGRDEGRDGPVEDEGNDYLQDLIDNSL